MVLLDRKFSSFNCSLALHWISLSVQLQPKLGGEGRVNEAARDFGVSRRVWAMAGPSFFFSIIIIPHFLFVFCITVQFQGNVWFLTYSDGIK